MTQSTVEYPERDVEDLTEEAPIRVLHVDDEVGFLKAARPCLEMQGAFHVDTASSVEEAMEKMKQKPYDVIVSDYIMPGKDGLVFLEELRDSGNNIPFIIFTGKGREIVAIKALNLGADQYVNKIGSPEVVYSELAHGIRKIVETKRAEEAQRRSEERYRSLFLNMLDGFAYCKMIFDEKCKPADFVYLEVNDAFEKLTGLKKEDVLGKKVTEFIPGIKKAHPELFAIYGRVALTGKEEEFDIHFKPLDIWLSISVYSSKKGYFVAVFDNITERKKAEEALKESEEHYRTLTQISPVGIFRTDPKGNPIFVNKRWCEIAGMSFEESLRDGWVKALHPDDRECIYNEWQAFVEGERPYEVECRFLRENGEIRWVLGKAIAETDEGGAIKGYVGTVTDITERKKAEEDLKETLEKLEAMNEKLSVVGDLTRHDARNRLSAMTMNAFLAKEKLANDTEALEHLSQIESACRDIERIFDFARIYEKIGSEKLAYMDVEKTLDETVRLFSDLRDVKVANDCKSLTVLSDSLLRQLFYNLIDNSLKHCEKVSRIRVHYEEAGKDKLKLVYEDDGVGIPRAEKEKIFTEGYGKGTGYGLYLIRKMCEVYGWDIRETGKQGKGAQFTMTIPKMNESGRITYRLH